MNITKKYILANFIQDLFNDNLYYQNTSWYTTLWNDFYRKNYENKI